MGLYFQEVPTVNPSVTATPCQLPLAREPLGCSDEAPLAIVGVPRQRRGGGIPQAGRFPHRFVLSRSTSRESLSHGYAVPAPFGKGAFGVQRRSPPGHCGGASAPPRRGDSPGKACGTSYLFPLHYSLKTFPFPHGFVLWWSANCESLSRLRRQLPLAREPLGA